MKSKIFVDHNSIINWIPEDETGAMEKTTLGVEVLEQLVMEHQPAKILVDLTKAQRPNHDQRQIIIRALRDNLDHICCIAFFGQSAVLKAITYFIINATNFGHIKFFDNRTEAVQWLQDMNK